MVPKSTIWGVWNDLAENGLVFLGIFFGGILYFAWGGNNRNIEIERAKMIKKKNIIFDEDKWKTEKTTWKKIIKKGSGDLLKSPSARLF